MKALQTQFDGSRIKVPPELQGASPCELNVMVMDPTEHAAWSEAQQQALHDVWDNPEDSVYDDV